jgi:hypothetical protein
LDSEDNVRPGLEGKALDFWYRPTPTDAPPSSVRLYDQRYSDRDSRIIQPQGTPWELRSLFQAAVNSEGIDLMIRTVESNPPTPDWVSRDPDHPQRVIQTFFWFRNYSLHRNP